MRRQQGQAYCAADVPPVVVTVNSAIRVRHLEISADAQNHRPAGASRVSETFPPPGQ